MHSCKSSFPYAVQPHAVVVRRTLYRWEDAFVLQCFDCTFAFFLCHDLLYFALPWFGGGLHVRIVLRLVS